MAPFESYADALRWLYTLPNWETAAPGQRPHPDLARPRALFERLGVTDPPYPAVIVAGTNGKGSTAAMLDSILSAAGHRVGLYTQPHLHTYRERIQVDRTPIPEAAFADRLARVRDAVAALQAACPELGRITTYEATTALALLHFAAERVAVAVLEVGLGGRLDAVNAVAAPVSVLTPIGLDHMETLGDTLAAIAGEKADVIKPGGIAVTAPQAPEALAVLRAVATARGADLRVVAEMATTGNQAGAATLPGADPAMNPAPNPLDQPGHDNNTSATDWEASTVTLNPAGEPTCGEGTGAADRVASTITPAAPNEPARDDSALPHAVRREGARIVGRRTIYEDLRLGLLGDHQWTNAAVAVAAAEALAERGLALPAAAVPTGLARARWPGRLEVLAAGPPLVLADGAHNPAGAATLAAALDRYFPAPRRLLVLGVSSDKDLAGIVAALAPVVTQVYATEARHPRSAPREAVARAARALGLPVKTIPDVAAAIRFARLQRGAGDLVVVAGSLYVVAEARVAFGRAHESDPAL